MRICDETWATFQHERRECLGCGASFGPRRHIAPVRFWKQEFCCRQCSRRAKMLPLAQRFERHFVPEPNSGCWLWIGAHGRRGYGQLADESRRLRIATHVSWFLRHGEWPVLWVLHKCDTPPCVNPDHLWLGTRSDNIRDMIEKGRQDWSGLDVGRLPRKLTALDKQLIISSGEDSAFLARRFGVHRTYVTEIRRRAAALGELAGIVVEGE